ncbi:hypothetical protein CC78DRAFT_608629 [Lojkania enalia]|uniref:SnoaL-like domain-containing protein n=1 Tax=Lojkania enalia TaxID=147567 RepID=A0A9P4K345_9PLEO|nr:hypothetical protein CC78DRAFT_608629 [Didymosphaeria enalia]
MATEFLLSLATAFLDAFTNLSAEDHIALRAPNCIHNFAPSSLAPHLPPPKDNQTFAIHLTRMQSILAHFPVTPKEIFVSAPSQIVIWATGVPEFKAEARGEKGPEEWEYVGEYCFVLGVNGEGKIERILEFLDSKATMKLISLMEEAKKNLAASQEI